MTEFDGMVTSESPVLPNAAFPIVNGWFGNFNLYKFVEPWNAAFPIVVKLSQLLKSRLANDVDDVKAIYTVMLNGVENSFADVDHNGVVDVDDVNFAYGNILKSEVK